MVEENDGDQFANQNEILRKVCWNRYADGKGLKLERIDVGNEVNWVYINKEIITGKHAIHNNVCVCVQALAVKFILNSKGNNSKLFEYPFLLESSIARIMSIRLKRKPMSLHYFRTKAARENYIMRCIKW